MGALEVLAVFTVLLQPLLLGHVRVAGQVVARVVGPVVDQPVLKKGQTDHLGMIDGVSIIQLIDTQLHIISYQLLHIHVSIFMFHGLFTKTN